MPIKPELIPQQTSRRRCPARGIASNRHLFRNDVSIQTDTERRQSNRKVVANVVDVLLSVDKLIKGGDAIMAEKLLRWSAMPDDLDKDPRKG